MQFARRRAIGSLGLLLIPVNIACCMYSPYIWYRRVLHSVNWLAMSPKKRDLTASEWHLVLRLLQGGAADVHVFVIDAG